METQVAQLKQQARHAYDRRDFRTALTIFQSILRKHPQFADIRHLAGLCYSFLGESEAALEQFDLALAANPAYVEAHVNRALTLNELGRFEEAREAFAAASHYEQEVGGEFPAAVTARLANAHAAVGDLYVEAGAHQLAAEQYRRALSLRPRFQDIRNKLAQSLLQLGDLEAAATELRRALEVNGGFLQARANLGLAYYRMGRLEEAVHEWEECELQEPDNPQVRAFMSLVHRRPEEPTHG